MGTWDPRLGSDGAVSLRLANASVFQPMRRPASLLHALVALIVTISAAGAEPPKDSSVEGFFAVLGSEPDSVPDLTVADVRAAIAAGAPLQASRARDTTPLMYVPATTQTLT